MDKVIDTIRYYDIIDLNPVLYFYGQCKYPWNKLKLNESFDIIFETENQKNTKGYNIKNSGRSYLCYHNKRDLNASINIENVGLSTLSSRGIKACGESVRLYEVLDSEAVSVKQEENKNLSKLNLAKIL